jgi:hypothetical protein
MLSDPQRQKSTSNTRRLQRKFISKKLAILVTLLILLLGSANFVPVLALGTLTESEETAGTNRISRHNTDDSFNQLTRPDLRHDPGHDITTTLTIEVLPPRQIDIPASTPTPAPRATTVSLPATTPTHISTTTLQSDIKHVVIISIDGMRPEALDLADTPTLDGLRAKGAYSPNAQTIDPSYTLPSHVSMLNGVVPKKHGIVEALPCIGCRLTIGPTLFSVAHDAGLSTGMVFGKQKLDYLVLENSVDKLFGADVHDTEVKDQAIAFIQEGLPNVLFIHLPDTDGVGHAYGWMSPNQLYAITFADDLVGEIVAALENEGYLNSTLLIITADHGGHDFKHGLDCPEDRNIPWLAVGPGVPQGVALTTNINTFDTAATALYALEVPIPEHWDGQPVLEIFQ